MKRKRKGRGVALTPTEAMRLWREPQPHWAERRKYQQWLHARDRMLAWIRDGSVKV